MSELENKGEHIMSLAHELLGDIELGRLPAEQLILKVSRLARLAGSDEIKQWLKYELRGYSGSGQVALKYMSLTGRWVKKEEKKGYWKSLAGIESMIQTGRLELQTMRIPDSGGSVTLASPQQLVFPQQLAVANTVIGRLTNTYITVNRLAVVKGNVMSLLHSFVSDVYYERVFSGKVEGVFERYKMSVDTQLAGRCGDVLEKFPAVYNRLAEGDPEAVSQALNTCRRIIDTFADSVYPASDRTIEVGGNTLKLGQQNVLNRINAYVIEQTSSSSRRDKIRQNLANLYSRACSGVHSEVSHEEAQSLLLNVYLVLGEILSLPNPQVAK